MKNSKATKPQDFLEKTFTLLQPVGDDNQTESVTVKPITVAQNVELKLPDEKFELEDQVRLVIVSTGLTEDEVYSLTKPDFNSIFEAAYNFLTLDAYHLAGKDISESKFELNLLFTGDRHIQFKYPTLRLSKQSQDFTDDVERAVFIISNITDLDGDEVENMVMPDYRSLVSHTNDFLLNPAAFYQ
tara:strand:+ start:2916 stop:3473 length:558 start_codon:yes stop_codon:yes gene_type:complete